MLSPLGITVLSAVVLVVVAVEVLVLKLRGRDDSFLVMHARLVALLHTRLFYGLRIVGDGDPIPPKGAFIVVANHQSGVDPLLLSLVTRRQVRFLMAREYYETRGLRWLFRGVRSIPVNRDGKDLGATKTALRALYAGETIGIFPQGGIREAKVDLDEGKEGVALLALKTAAPVIPFYIDGSPTAGGAVFRALVTASKTTVYCGKPIHFTETPKKKPSRSEREEVTEAILQAILDLRPAQTTDSPLPTSN